MSRVGALPHGCPAPERSRPLRAAAVLMLVAAAAAMPAAGQLHPRPAREPVVRPLDSRFAGLVAPRTRLERIVDDREWAEGPLWVRDGGYLLFSDVVANRIYRWSRGDGLSVFLERSGYSGTEAFAGREPGSNGLALDGAGRLVFARHGDRRIVRREADGSLTVLAERYMGKRLNSPNDLVYRSDGALYFTDPPFGLPGSYDDPARELRHQGVYRLAADGALALLTGELSAPNGIAFSPDERTLYVSNADARRLVWMAYPVEADGTLGAGRVLFDGTRAFAGRRGTADGMKVDRDGNLFAVGPGGVYVFAPDGTLLGWIDVGGNVGNVAWGEDGATLFIAANAALYRLRTRTSGAGWPRAAP